MSDLQGAAILMLAALGGGDLRRVFEAIEDRSMHEDDQETSEMPHFKDGTEVKVGDRVRGVGYNPDQKGYDRTHGIEGIVIAVRPGEDRPQADTLDIAFLRVRKPQETRGAVYLAGDLVLVTDVEHGDTVGFEPVGKAGG